MGRTLANVHPVIHKDEASQCPWCDGTGWRVRAAYHHKPPGLHGCDWCMNSNLAKDVDFVPCEYCAASGKRAR